jgi:transcriptional regulator GlxA family with amidase domain
VFVSELPEGTQQEELIGLFKDVRGSLNGLAVLGILTLTFSVDRYAILKSRPCQTYWWRLSSFRKE